MIGYDRLGSNGRFGNQLFQFCALRGIASHHGYDWCVPPDDHVSFGNYGVLFPFKMESMSEKNIGFINGEVGPEAMRSFGALASLNPNINNLPEQVQKFDIDFVDRVTDGSNIDGYFQTEKYFKHIEDELRRDLKFKDDILEPCNDFISQFENIIFLHVRRSDYINIQESHPLLSFKYYEEALKHFDDDSYVLVCSDDIEWCAEQEFFESDRFLMSNHNETYQHGHLDADGQVRKSPLPFTDMCMMSLCNGAIIANSSMSWWGAWLQANPDKKVIAPAEWYGPNLAHVDDSDLVPDTWIKIDEK
ncbi:MAG: alpha-1,2-fucosyltransferase [Acidimicrobiaceae bacterium]|jgi:hypothetical protein|nr:alpha-1,2-fucosyltransferase [Acidimicrobiaceae bacterium]|tara:strand:- start:4694 stop:5605 length:912 start_codon:yes stop_codon:yes gene_type:complete